MTKLGKKYRDSKKLVTENNYAIAEAVALAKQTSYTKFDGTIEVAIKTFADPKYNDQNIRATVVLPHGTGKTQKVAVFATDADAEAAKKAGADIVGYETLLTDIKAGKLDFDVLVTTPGLMKELAPIAKVLWPKGLMPSPKAGTVTADITTAVNEVKKGRLEFKLDKTGNIHSKIGRTSFDDEQLVENFNTLIKAIEENKPSGVKGKLIKKIVISPTMGAWVPVSY